MTANNERSSDKLAFDWLPVFFDRHRKRYAAPDWPAIGSEDENLVADLWLHHFRRKRVTEDEAEYASKSLAMHPPKFRNDHLPALMDEIIEHRNGGRQLMAGVDPNTGQPLKDRSAELLANNYRPSQWREQKKTQENH